MYNTPIDRVFFDVGERISHCVQMWWYYLQGLQADLWNSLPPKIAANMYGKVFDHTYGILVGRYAKVLKLFKYVENVLTKKDQYNLANGFFNIISTLRLPAFRLFP